MAGLPQKSIKGANLKKWLIEAVDGIIDYLKSGIYLVPGPGISIERKPSGIVISATKPSVSAPPSVKAASSVQDISATVTGGTATITLSGSTSSVPVVAGSNVNITGGTNGEVIIGATGGTGSVGFPNYSNPIEALSFDTAYSYPYPVWLVGSVGYNSASSGTTIVCGFYLVDGTGSAPLFFWQGSDPPTDSLEVPVMIPVPANTEFEISTVHIGSPTDVAGSITSYPCI